MVAANCSDSSIWSRVGRAITRIWWRHNAALLFGTIDDSSRAHGTAVLGAVCATGAWFADGVVPQLAEVAVSSFTPSYSNIPNALIAALDTTLQNGGVLLLEAQTSTPLGGPIELLDYCFPPIEMAAGLGVTVVEAAGNGGLNLGATPNAAGKYVLNPGHMDFRESWAVIVGSATSTVPHEPGGSSFGKRVNCYAWGDHVETTSSNVSGAKNIYDCNFTGTSAAAPIVAGAALAVQGIACAAGGAPLRHGICGTSSPTQRPAQHRMTRRTTASVSCRTYGPSSRNISTSTGTWSISATTWPISGCRTAGRSPAARTSS